MSQSIQFGDHPFAVKEHWATHLHWDLRLNLYGRLLLSFALDSPPHLNPDQPLKAVRTPNHNGDHLLSERIIPLDWPGAGPTAIWDRGLFRALGNESMTTQLSHGHLRIYVIGKRLNGNFSLKKIGSGEHDWLWIKENDEYADPLRRFPNVLTPDKINELKNRAS
jgi:bifunctional non-homologous end joining protein LigD